MKGLLLGLLCFAATLCAGTRGQANNNPGNLRSITPLHWQGAVGVDEDGFIRFRRPIDGVRAVVVNLKVYRKKHSIRTVRGIIRRWTHRDHTDEERKGYIDFVSKRLGVKPDSRLNMHDAKTLYILTRAIVYWENGGDPYPDKLYQRIFPNVLLPPRPPST